MKKITSVAILLMSVVMVWAQQPKPSSPTVPLQKDDTAVDTAKGGPIMTLASDVIDYGNIEYAGDPLRTVAFTNTGTAPLIISNAKGSCGCTVPEWPHDPIQPGETSEIKVRYDTKRPGPINKTVKITTNEAGTNTHTLRVIGHIAAQEPQGDALPKKEGVMSNGGGN